MQVRKAKREDGSCNFCNEKFSSETYLFCSDFSGGLIVRICSDCFRELITKIRNL